MDIGCNAVQVARKRGDGLLHICGQLRIGVLVKLRNHIRCSPKDLPISRVLRIAEYRGNIRCFYRGRCVGFVVMGGDALIQRRHHVIAADGERDYRSLLDVGVEGAAFYLAPYARARVAGDGVVVQRVAAVLRNNAEKCLVGQVRAPWLIAGGNAVAQHQIRILFSGESRIRKAEQQYECARQKRCAPKPRFTDIVIAVPEATLSFVRHPADACASGALYYFIIPSPGVQLQTLKLS